MSSVSYTYLSRFTILSEQFAELFDDYFIETLFEYVEKTRNMPDETLNYSFIKLLVRLHGPR